VNYKSAVRKLSGGPRIFRKGAFDAGKGIGMLKILVECFFDDGGKYRIKSENLRVTKYANHYTTRTGASKI
jgi:hypothetical protein